MLSLISQDLMIPGNAKHLDEPCKHSKAKEIVTNTKKNSNNKLQQQGNDAQTAQHVTSISLLYIY